MSVQNAHARLIPVIVAIPIFLQNLTASVLATVLPTIAQSLHTDPLHLNLAITLYLLSLAVFLPLSGWMADRYGSHRVFCCAIVLFSIGSVCCALSGSLSQLAASRVVQGVGGAMMIPVGRLILLRTVPKSELMHAMVWFTVPPVFGSVAGPLLGGLVVTYVSWPWVFLLNIPFAATGLVLALIYIRDDTPLQSVPFDFRGYLLIAGALTSILLGLVVTGKGLLPIDATFYLVIGGLVCCALFWRHARRIAHPAIDFSLLRFVTFRSAIFGGFLVRTGLGATPFVLPLMLQLGFGMKPLEAGTLTFAWALGSLFTRPVIKKSLNVVGFRRMLLIATALSSVMYCAYGLFRPETSHPLIFIILLFGGSVRGLLMISMNTLGYSEIPSLRMSHATVLASMTQQVSMTFGVAIAVLLLNATLFLHGAEKLGPNDFWLTFTVVALISANAIWFFIKLPNDAGEELRGPRASAEAKP